MSAEIGHGAEPGGLAVPVEDVHRALAEASTDLIAVIDRAGRVVCASAAARYVLGYEPAELGGRHFSEFVPADAIPEAGACFEDGRAQTVFNRRGRVRGKDGRLVAVRFNAAPVTSADGAVRGMVVILLPEDEAPGSRPPPGEGPRPTPRELEVLQLLAIGYTGTGVARKLFLSPDTVRNHARSAREKLGAKTRAHAIAIAVDRGLIDV